MKKIIDSTKERAVGLAEEAKGWGFWGRGLIEASIGGGAGAVSSSLGMIGAERIGMDVPILNFQSIGVIAASGALIQAVNYLKSYPLPK